MAGDFTRHALPASHRPEHALEDAKFQVGQRVHVSSVTSRRFVGIIVDRFEEDGEWFYSLDRKNYLHEAMLEDAQASEGLEA